MGFLGVLGRLSVLLVCLCTCANATANATANVTAILKILGKQLQLQQLYIDEISRLWEPTGIKQMRVNNGGSKPYNYATHSARSIIAMHDHANYRRTIGLGEFAAVLNGVNFRTRHNDYRAVMPLLKGNTYHGTEDIKFPKVPRKVTKKSTVVEQTDEMKEYFRAFINQDPNHRDYEEHFKPILCYLEGHWTTATDKIEEPFGSDRHAIDASTMDELMEKVMYTAATGGKSNLENFAYLPVNIINVTEDGTPIFAQWTYRILCHPLTTKVPLSRLRVADDLTARMTYSSSMKDVASKRCARFELDPRLDLNDTNPNKLQETFLDKLMGEIPGLDNYEGKINDSSFGLASYEPRADDSDPLVLQNAAYYHRYYETSKKGAGGLTSKKKGFSDSHIFMAQTTNPRVPKVCILYEGRDEIMNKKVKYEECKRTTYAIPLEIIYMTPLSEWNPYNIPDKGDMFGEAKTDEAEMVRVDGRNGAQNSTHAYNGTNSRTFYRTPKEFFEGRGNVEQMSADTSSKNVGVLDGDGNLKIVGPSGFRIMFNIDGVGTFRQRYPIVPLASEGNPIMKELRALMDVVLSKMENSTFPFYN